MPKGFLVELGVALILLIGGSTEAANQLVSYNSSGHFHLHESALRDIEELQSPIIVLAVVGDARIGKSTFLNMIDLHWDPTFKRSGTAQFEVGDTGRACTRGLWIHTRRLPQSGSLVLVDVEGDNLGNDAVTEKLSAMTALISSYILLCVRRVVSNSDLEFLYHTTELGKMFPDSTNFPDLGVAVFDALKVDPTFPDRQSEVSYAITSPTHKDGNDEMRGVIAAVFPPNKISAFEVAYHDREQLKNLPDLGTGAYFDSVQRVISQLKRSASQKSTPVNGMLMCGGDLVQMIRKLYAALDNGDITTLETAYERLEKQMCDTYYSEWIAPVTRMASDEFMNTEQHNLLEFSGRCKIDSYIDRVRQEMSNKKDGIIREREETKRRRKAEEAKARAEEEERRAKERQRIAEEKQKAEERQRKATEEKLQKEAEERKRAEENETQAVEQAKKAQAEKAAAEDRLRQRSSGFSISIGPFSFSFEL